MGQSVRVKFWPRTCGLSMLMVSLCFLAFLFERRKADKPKNVLQDLIPPRCEVSRKRDGSSFILSGFSRAVLVILYAACSQSLNAAYSDCPSSVDPSIFREHFLGLRVRHTRRGAYSWFPRFHCIICASS